MSITRDPRTSPPVRVSYPQVFTPSKKYGKYGVVLMIDKKNKEQMDFMRALHKDASEILVEKWPNPETRPRIPFTGHDRSLFKDGDTALNSQGIPFSETNPEYVGHYFMRANSTQKPILVDKGRQEILDANEIYGGCYCKVNINAYEFNQDMNRGVTLGLNGLQKWADGEPFGGGRPPVDEMFEVESGADNPENYATGDDPF